MATRAYHNPDNVEILDMHRSTKLPDSHTLFPPEGCCQPPPGAKATVMLFYAKRAAKEEMKAKGIRISSILPREVRLLAEELLQERWEEFERLAQPVLLRIAKSNIKTNEKKRKASKSKASAVQMS